jgi:hypothetical protein
MIDEDNPAPLKLLSVSGYENRSNDLLYCAPRLQNDRQTVVYFGGDIQVPLACRKRHLYSRRFRTSTKT